MVRLRGRERAFTIVELMIVVAIIAVLAFIAVPAWTRESRKVKADTEVGAMFSELAVKLEQWKLERATYVGATAAQCPSAPVATGYNFVTTCRVSGSIWETLRVNSPETTLKCAYAITVGDSATAPTPPTPFTMAAPASSWYFVTATCDMDGQGGTNAQFFLSSVDAKMQKANYNL